MTIRFLCPWGHSLSVPDDWAGRQIRCAACKELVYVPERSEGKPSAKAARGGSSGELPEPADSEPGSSQQHEDSATRTVPPPLPSSEGPGQGPTRRPKARRRPRMMPADVYRADEGNLATVKWLALILGLVVAFSVAPVFLDYRRLNLATAPDWARVVLLVAAVQAVYIAWMLGAPDWASVWVVMLVFAAASTLYAVATAVAIATPLEYPMWLEMDKVGSSAQKWCGSVLAAMSLATYLCGRTATKWRRTFELETAGRRNDD
jgi:hypothetical protein